jgi:hypothetical protein
MDRLVETVVLTHLRDRFVINLDGPATCLTDVSRNAATQIEQDLAFRRTAWKKMDQDENNQRDANKGGNDQKQAADEVSGHCL